MVEAHAEGKRHQQIVQTLVRSMLKKGCPPGEIRISGIQNPDIGGWARRKGVVFDMKQGVNLLFPEGYEG